MKNLDLIAEELFNKIRGRFPSVTIGDGEGKVTNKPTDARFYDFDYKEGNTKLGKVSITLSEDAIEVMFSDDFVANEDSITRQSWYNFLKELRSFSKKRLMKFDTRNINKSNLDKRDYKFLATNRTGDETMTETKLYGTSKTSYQNVGEARLAIKHSKPVNQESATGRIRNISAIYIESAEGERFKYPYRHLNGARAMARHVAEGGKPYDDFGKHITGLSEELSSLKKFKSYMNRSSVMAEGLSDYTPIVNERVEEIKKTISSLQKESYYKEAFEGYETPVMEDVPEDVAENWIDQLTIRQFNEELKDVFPYVYKLVSEATRTKQITSEDGMWDKVKSGAKAVGDYVFGDPEEEDRQIGILTAVLKSNGYDDFTIKRIKNSCLNDPRVCLYNTIRKAGLETGDMDVEVAKIGKELNSGLTTMSGTVNDSIENKIDQTFDEMMGQFGEGFDPEHFDGETEFYAVGDDGEETTCTLSYTATIIDGKPVVHPKSLSLSCPMDHNSKLGFDDDMDFEMQDADEMLAAAQEDADQQWAERDDKYAQGESIEESECGCDDKGASKQQVPVTEYILSMFDRETGQFPKGETAVLTAIEKDYGEQFINPAKHFISRVQECYATYKEDDTDRWDRFFKRGKYKDPLGDDDDWIRDIQPSLGGRKKGKNGPVIDLDPDEVDEGPMDWIQQAANKFVGKKKKEPAPVTDKGQKPYEPSADDYANVHVDDRTGKATIWNKKTGNWEPTYSPKKTPGYLGRDKDTSEFQAWSTKLRNKFDNIPDEWKAGIDTKTPVDDIMKWMDHLEKKGFIDKYGRAGYKNEEFDRLKKLAGLN